MGSLVKLSNNNFKHLLHLPDYLIQGVFTDISIAVWDEKSKFSIKCHRIVLGSCSPFLKNLIDSNPETSEIMLENVTKEELDSIITFLYTGVINFQDLESQNLFINLISNLGIYLSSIMVDIPVINDDVPPLSDEFWILEEKDFLSTIDESALSYESPYFELDHLNPVLPFTEVTNKDNEDPKKKKRRRRFHCQYCDKAFPSNYYLKFHESSVHSKVKSFTCTFCNKVFSESYYLRQHLRRMHSEMRQFICSSCPSSFSVRYDLVVHERTHESIKQFRCQYCNKTYANQRALREHRRTHTGERPYECQDCGKRFALPKTLRVHYRQHSGERPYLCSHCGMTFVQNSTLKNHLKSNHKNL